MPSLKRVKTITSPPPAAAAAAAASLALASALASSSGSCRGGCEGEKGVQSPLGGNVIATSRDSEDVTSLSGHPVPTISPEASIRTNQIQVAVVDKSSSSASVTTHGVRRTKQKAPCDKQFKFQRLMDCHKIPYDDYNRTERCKTGKDDTPGNAHPDLQNCVVGKKPAHRKSRGRTTKSILENLDVKSGVKGEDLDRNNGSTRSRREISGIKTKQSRSLATTNPEGIGARTTNNAVRGEQTPYSGADNRSRPSCLVSTTSINETGSLLWSAKKAGELEKDRTPQCAGGKKKRPSWDSNYSSYDLDVPLGGSTSTKRGVRGEDGRNPLCLGGRKKRLSPDSSSLCASIEDNDDGEEINLCQHSTRGIEKIRHGERKRPSSSVSVTFGSAMETWGGDDNDDDNNVNVSHGHEMTSFSSAKISASEALVEATKFTGSSGYTQTKRGKRGNHAPFTNCPSKSASVTVESSITKNPLLREISEIKTKQSRSLATTNPEGIEARTTNNAVRGEQTPYSGADNRSRPSCLVSTTSSNETGSLLWSATKVGELEKDRTPQCAGGKKKRPSWDSNYSSYDLDVPLGGSTSTKRGVRGEEGRNPLRLGGRKKRLSPDYSSLCVSIEDTDDGEEINLCQHSTRGIEKIRHGERKRPSSSVSVTFGSAMETWGGDDNDDDNNVNVSHGHEMTSFSSAKISASEALVEATKFTGPAGYTQTKRGKRGNDAPFTNCPSKSASVTVESSITKNPLLSPCIMSSLTSSDSTNRKKSADDVCMALNNPTFPASSTDGQDLPRKNLDEIIANIETNIVKAPNSRSQLQIIINRLQARLDLTAEEVDSGVTLEQNNGNNEGREMSEPPLGCITSRVHGTGIEENLPGWRGGTEDIEFNPYDDDDDPINAMGDCNQTEDDSLSRDKTAALPAIESPSLASSTDHMRESCIKTIQGKKNHSDIDDDNGYDESTPSSHNEVMEVGTEDDSSSRDKTAALPAIESPSLSPDSSSLCASIEDNDDGNGEEINLCQHSTRGIEKIRRGKRKRVVVNEKGNNEGRDDGRAGDVFTKFDPDNDGTGLGYSHKEEGKQEGKKDKVARQNTTSVRLSTKLVTNKYDTAWEERYRELIEFKRAYGHCNVPQRQHGGLGRWVNMQRQKCKDDKRIKLLNDIGFVWKVYLGWEMQFKKLVEYKKAYGTCNVPRVYPEDQSLAWWVRDQRAFYKYFKAGEYAPRMNIERIAKLEDIGFCWVCR